MRGREEFEDVRMQMTTDNPSSRQRFAAPKRVVGPFAPASRPQRRVSVRTCIACRQTGSPLELVRMVIGTEGQVAFDLAGGAIGRGAWVHPTEPCLRKARKSTARSLTRNSAGEPMSPELSDSLARAAVRRGAGLVGAAYRARHLALGSDACREAFHEMRAKLVILATDARAAQKESWLESAAAQGLLAAWSTKAELGAMVGREELAVLVVTDEGLAQNLRRVMAMTIPLASRLAKAATDSTGTTGSQGRLDSEDG